MKKRPLSLRVRILLSCMACMMAAMLIQLALFTRSSSSIISAQMETINQNTLMNLSDDLYARFKAVENSLISVYEYDDFLRALRTEPADGVQKQYADLAYSMAFHAFEPTQDLDALYIYTDDHQLISSYRHAQTPIYTYPDDIYDMTMKGADEGVREIVQSNPSVMAVTSYYNEKRDTRLVRCILRILENSKTPAGYMVCDLDPKGYNQLLNKYRYSDGQSLWLQTQGHPAVFGMMNSDTEDSPQARKVMEALAAGEETGTSDHVLYVHKMRKYDMKQRSAALQRRWA